MSFKHPRIKTVILDMLIRGLKIKRGSYCKSWGEGAKPDKRPGVVLRPSFLWGNFSPQRSAEVRLGVQLSIFNS